MPSPRRLTALALLCSASLAACAPPAEDLAGSYRRSHRVFVFHGNEPVEVEAEDHLVLEVSGTGLALSLRIRGDGGHGCEMEGMAFPERRGFALRSPPSSSCLLRLRREAGAIVVEDVGESCRAHFCSGAVAIGRLAFPLTEPAPG